MNLMRGSWTAFERERASGLNRLSSQLFWCLLFGLIVPFSLYFWSDIVYYIRQPSGRASFLSAIVAIIAGVIIVRRMAAYPGASVIRSIVPAFMVSFGVVALVLLVLRLPYSSAVMLLSFGSVVPTRAIMDILARRVSPITYFIVPGGKVDRSLQSLGSSVRMISNPKIPASGDAVIVADLHFEHSDKWVHFFANAALAGVPVFHYKQIWEELTGRVRVEHLSENSFGSLLPSLSYRSVKRVVDTAICLALVPFLALPLTLVAALIKLDSPGNIFFRQERIGFGGKPFKVLKFRTMREGNVTSADALDDAITREADARITKLGSFLRRSRIDEIPQIFNILRGEMSWIGPRPEAAPLSEWYQREIPFYLYRHIVRPGITGWAQVNQGHVTEINDITEKLQYDFFYIKNFSYWIDLSIAMRTVVVMLNGFGAR